MNRYLILIITITSYTSQKQAYAFVVASLRVLDTRIHTSRKGFENENVQFNKNSPTLSSQSSANLSHIAFICDGNSRWEFRSSRIDSLQHRTQTNSHKDEGRYIGNASLVPKLGHAKGAARVIALTQDIFKRYPQVRWLTMYAFSTENWSRPPREIAALWQVMEKYCDEFFSWAMGNLAIKIMGDIDDERIPISLRERLKKIEYQTNRKLQDSISITPNKHHDITIPTCLDSEEAQSQPQQVFTLCIAINYGGRKDIIHATRQIAEAYHRGNLNMEDINEERFDQYLCTSGIPSPDLVIRTGGDQRLSNFLLWQSAYAELYFTDVLWPDFDETCLDKAIQWYVSRDRRFGGHP